MQCRASRSFLTNVPFSYFKHALGVLPSVLGHVDKDDTAKPPFLFCTVFFGANDCSLPTARQYLDIESYDSNVRKIVSEIQR